MPLTDALERCLQTLAQRKPADDVGEVVRALVVDLRGERQWVTAHHMEVDMRAAGVVDPGPRDVVADLAEMDELALLLEHVDVDVVWSTRAKWQRDAVDSIPTIATIATVPERARALGETDAHLRLTVHLPCWLAASRLERERALHALLMGYCPDDAENPKRLLRHRPDVVAHAATLGRYGVGTLREAQAIAHAVAHPSLETWTDEVGQLVWVPTQRSIAAAAERMAARPRVEEPEEAPAPPRRRRRKAA